jgi:hypothetical protein
VGVGADWWVKLQEPNAKTAAVDWWTQLSGCACDD